MSATINTSAGSQPLDPYKSKNFQDVPLQQKIEDLVNFIKEVKYGMLTTKLSTENDLLSSRCMALAGQEHSGIDLLFHTNLFSSKTLDLSIHPTETNMSFLDPVSGSWASISGTAHIVSDPETVKKCYTPSLKAWLGDLGDGVHDGGPNDPRIGIIRLEAKLVTYAVAREGMVERAYESVKGVATGDVPEISSIRELREGELNEWRQTHKR
ncbi:blue light-inducible protein Bli-3 [Aspergillus sclerotialis]|uniref:Blue light-inducible protein Bli-3 n=1 Tax=Aspergillus sclerotialis TaxID=2070753 RepID=A0A3A2ZIG4_9EURO|nr:blue light-inducible protein Bli-3 [Aspergillus sclerotialis]